jgi:RNA polymerase sigma-70 factor (ECF subfamily)
MVTERAIGSASAERAAAFSDLAERHLADSYRLAAMILGNQADAQDATHDAFVSAWKHWGSLRDPDRFEAWFGKILVNVCRDRLRSSRRHGVRDVADISDELLTAAADGDPAVTAADHDAVGRGLARLEPDQRIVLVLRYYRDLPVDEIAARMGIPAGTVKSRLHYALRDLGVALGDERPEVTR